MATDIDLHYTPMQVAVFLTSPATRRILTKGRRLGFTRGAAQYVIESMLSRRYEKVLWGDTTNKNIRKYYELYFTPVLRLLPKRLWNYRIADKMLIVNGCTCDFCAAENPENWEGFGYDLVILNEAGIILKNRYLWENAVSPMLLDNPKSVCIIGGTPKGINLFAELWEGSKDRSEWEAFKYSTYDNPYLAKSAVDDLVKELGGAESDVVKQEIYGEFLDISAEDLFSHELINKALDHAGDPPSASGHLEIWALDIARQGPDDSVLAKRRDTYIYETRAYHLPNLMDMADRVAAQYHDAKRKPDAIFTEMNGMGYGVHDRLLRLGLPVLAADVSLRASTPKLLNRRTEMYFKLKTFLEQGGKLPKTPNQRLKDGLLAVKYNIGEDSNARLIPKAEITDDLKFSPDEADACALTFFAPVEPRQSEYEQSMLSQPLITGAW
jgi:hypothetical protein